MHLILCDTNTILCSAWRQYFDGEADVNIINAPFEQVSEYDCIVSPGNSFGLMDGGFDAAIIRKFGVDVMRRTQAQIMDLYAGEQPVGTSTIVGTGDADHPYLAHTPTMRTPKPITGTDHVYNAMRAMLLEVQWCVGINKILCPGLGTCTGCMSPDVAARQMYLAYKSIKHPPQKNNWDMAIKIERGLA